MKICNIKKSYGKNTVLKNISLEAEKGLCIGILGGNGCGKSTLLNILAGVIKADDGEFTFNGENMLDTKESADKIGFVPQNSPLFEELSAYDNLLLWYSKEALKDSLDNGVIAMLGIDKFIKVPVNKMSGGMKKRLAIACAVADNPEILLLDEPSAALDLVCKDAISSYLSEYKKNGGIIITATHDIQDLPLCDKLFILKNGVLEEYLFSGDISDLVKRL